MTVQAAVGGASVAAAVGIGAHQGTELAMTGVNHLALMFAIAFTLMVTGVILMGLTRRHGHVATYAVPDYLGPPPPPD